MEALARERAATLLSREILCQNFQAGVSLKDHRGVSQRLPSPIRNYAATGVLLWLLFFSNAPGAFGQYVSTAWTTENGLPDNDIRAITRTRDGYLWMTTNAGLVRFDGVQFRVFSALNTPGLLSDLYSFGALLEDKQGILWAGTSHTGAIFYHDGVFRTLTTKDGLPNDRVLRIDQGPDDRIWIFTNPGLSYWKQGKVSQVHPPPGASLEAPLNNPENFFGRDGPFWGKWRMDTVGWQRFAYGEWSRFPLPSRVKSPGELRIDSIFEDAKRRLWYKLHRDPGEYYCLEGGHLRVYRGLPQASFVAYLDDSNHLWISDRGGNTALWKDGRTESLKNLSTPSFFHVLEEADGGFWVGTLNAGIVHFRPDLIRWIAHQGGPEVGATLFRSSTGTLWVGSVGLAKFGDKPSQRVYPHGPGFSDGNLITALYEDATGTLWVGTRAGVQQFRNGRFRQDPLLKQIEGEISAIVCDRAGRLWFGTNRGLYRLSNHHVTVYKRADGLAGDSVTALLVDKKNRLWVGTDGGPSCLSGTRIKAWAETHHWQLGTVASLYEDVNNILWVGTNDRGLVRIEDDAPAYFTTNQGLPSNAIYQILDDNLGFLWLGTKNGLVRLRKDELSEFAAGRLKHITSTRFGEADGLVHPNCAALGQPGGYKANDGSLWFSTVGGIAIVDPKSLPIQSNPPDVLIEEELLDQHPASPKNGVLSVTPRQANLEIHYTALSGYKPEQISFRYQLVGLESDWVDAGTRRTAYYSHLPSGDYDFRVIAGNSSGVWNMQGRQLQIFVPAPFYLRGWFVTLMALTAAGLLIVVWQYRMGQITRAHAAQQAFSRQLIASQESERKRIAAELHDSLGQRLVVIKNLAAIFLNSRDGQRSPADGNVEEIVSEASEALGEVKVISYNLRPYQLDRIGLTKAIQALTRTATAASPIVFQAAIDNIDDIFPKVTQINFYRMVQEGVNNIIKHSDASMASVMVHREQHRILLTMSDDGKGFQTTHSGGDLGHTGFGLVGIVERAQLLGGVAIVQSEPGMGTSVRIEIKLKDIPNGR